MAEPIRVTHAETADHELEEDSRIRSLGSRTLEAQVRVVARQREIVASLQTVLAERERAFQDSVVDLAQQLNKATHECREAESILRSLTIGAYKETGEKKPAPGVGVRSETVVEYDELHAIEWARKHDEGKPCLKLNRATFERAAKALNLDFVEKSVELRATIARDLFAVLEKAEGGAS
jgi:hypothetical protein